MSDYTDLTYDVTDRIATITLNRPDRLNAISGPMLSSISRVLRDADARLGRFGGQRLEYALLALHALHGGFGAAVRDRQAGPT